MRVVDLFAGAGGASWGATLAGFNVLAAVNHWPLAIEAHARALPWAAHLCEDLERLSPMALPPHDVLWGSPECTGHTWARGKERNHHDASRATAFCPVRVADLHRPPAVIIENVVELEEWELLPGWLMLWQCLGYREQRLRLVASDFGVPQERERVYFVFTRKDIPAPNLSDPPRFPTAEVPDRRRSLRGEPRHAAWTVVAVARRVRAQQRRAHRGGGEAPGRAVPGSVLQERVVPPRMEP